MDLTKLGKKLSQTTSFDSKYICLFDVFLGEAHVFKVNNDGLLFLKTLQGKGEFLDNRHMLLIYDSDNGFLTGNSYIYDVITDVLCSFYLNDNDDAIFTSTDEIGYLLSYSSQIIVTSHYVILKDENGGVYFYDKLDIVKNKKLEAFYSLPKSDFGEDEFNIYEYDEDENLLAWKGEEDFLYRYIRPDFPNSRRLNVSIKPELSIKGNFYEGICLDYSITCEGGIIKPHHNIIGSFMHEFKLDGHEIHAFELANLISREIRKQFIFDVSEKVLIIPIPSDTISIFRSVSEIACIIGDELGYPVDHYFLQKSEQTVDIKKTQPIEEKRKILRESLTLDNSLAERYKDYTIILLDDEYYSGETFNVASKLITNKGKVKRILAVAVVKIIEQNS